MGAVGPGVCRMLASAVVEPLWEAAVASQLKSTTIRLLAPLRAGVAPPPELDTTAAVSFALLAAAFVVGGDGFTTSVPDSIPELPVATLPPIPCDGFVMILADRS